MVGDLEFSLEVAMFFVCLPPRSRYQALELLMLTLSRIRGFKWACYAFKQRSRVYENEEAPQSRSDPKMQRKGKVVRSPLVTGRV